MNITIPTETLSVLAAWTGSEHYRAGTVTVETNASGLRDAATQTAFVGDTAQTGTSARTMTYQDRIGITGFWTANPADESTPGWTTAPGIYNPGYAAWYGPGGPAYLGRGDGVIFPEQTLTAVTRVVGTVTPGSDTQASLTCQAIDTQYVQLVDAPTTWGTSAGQQRFTPTSYPTLFKGEPVWISGLFWATSDGQPLTDAIKEFDVWYGVAGPTGSTTATDCTGMTWYATPQEAQAASGQTAAAGTYPAVTHVMTYSRSTQLRGGFVGSDLHYSIAVPLALRDPAMVPTGTDYVGTWSGGATAFSVNPTTGTAWTPDQMRAAVADGSLAWAASSYDKLANDGTRGDRVTVTGAVAALVKEVVQTNANGSTSVYGPSDVWDTATQQWLPVNKAEVPRMHPAETFTYRLTPSLLGADPDTSWPITIEDCIPANLNILGASVGGVTVAESEPDESELACDTTNPNPFLREVHVAYTYPSTFPGGSTIPPLEITVYVRPTVPTVTDTIGIPGLVGGLLNEAVMSSPALTSSTVVRSARTRIYVDASTTYQLSKAPVDYFVGANPQGLAIEALMPQYDVVVSNPSGAPAGPVDLIDVLPVNGSPSGGSLRPSSFTGTYSILASTFVHGSEFLAAGAGGRRYMTGSPGVSHDPTNAANQPGGATLWCFLDPADSGRWAGTLDGRPTDACPAISLDPVTGQHLYSGVTGLRAAGGELPAGEFIQFRVRLVPEGNAGGDIYVNQAGATLGATPLAPTRSAAVRVIDAPQLSVAKSVTGASGPGGAATVGDTLTYAVTLTNVGTADFTPADPYFAVDDLGDVLDSGTLVEPLADGGTVVSADGRTQLHLQGVLAAGASATYTYAVRVEHAADGSGAATSASLANTVFAQPDGTSSDGSPVVPPATCTAPLCAQTDTELAVVHVEKAVAGATGAGGIALPGDVLTYTLSVSNAGSVALTDANPAVVIDDLAGVLDNATLVEGSATFSSGRMTSAGGRVTWWGPLAPGATATLTYQVTVTAAASGAVDNRAVARPVQDPDANPDTAPSFTLPASCDTADPTCARTSTPVTADRSVTVTKTVTGATGPGGAAVPGDELTYRVTATHSGDWAFTAADPALVVDDLTGVLDNATLLPGATATVGATAVGTIATTTSGQLQWSGPLAPREQLVLTYRVRVEALAGADDTATNIAFVTGRPAGYDPADPTDVTAPDAAGCLSPSCATTSSPVTDERGVTVTKSVAGGSGPGGFARPGDTLTYVVTAQHQGDLAFTGEEPLVLVDDLSRVLDGATLDAASVSATSGTATVRGQQVVWSGPLAVGAGVTLRYTVRVTDQGDGDLTNVAFQTPAVDTDADPSTPPGPPPGVVALPTTCAAPTCATTTTRATYQRTLQVGLQVSGTSGEQGAARPGDVLRYTVTVTNTGDSAFTPGAPAVVANDLT